MKKRIIALILTLILALTLVPSALADDTTVSNPAQVLKFGLRGGHGPMSITKGTLHGNYRVREVYLVCLSGANLSFTRKDNFDAFFASALSIHSEYYATAKKNILKTVPDGANIIFAGHSAGGNVAQQLACDSTIRAKYTIINTLACGSPEVIAIGREGTLHRLCDALDPVPYISLAFPANFFLEISYQWGDYSKLQNPHADSYYNEKAWSNFDCLGNRNGVSYFTCNYNDCVSFSLKR